MTDPTVHPEPPTRVVIRTFRRGGDTIALFPDFDEGRGLIGSYQHVGQHGPADPSVVSITRQATDEEAAPLLRELRAIGYNPVRVRRLTRPRYS